MAERFRIEFSDIKAIEWRISIGETSFAGSYTSLQATGNPLRFAYENSSDDVFDPIRPSYATFEVLSTTNFALQDFYSLEDKYFTVDIYQNEALYWKGFIETRNYREVYEPVKYPVSIKATDGLSLLKDILYADSISYALGVEDITYYNGRQRESKIILDILSEIDHTSFYEFVNLYEDDMLSTSTDSPFDQIEIDVDVFKGWYCWDVLNELLKKYNAFIRQRNGVFYIVRPTELADTSVYGRYFTGETTKTGVTLEPDQFIKRTTTHPSSRRIQVPGGELMIQAPAKKVSVFQDYGNKLSWIDNHEFLSKYWDGTDFQNWTQTTSTLVLLLGNAVSGETEGAYLYARNTYPTLAYYIYQSFGADAILSTTDIFSIEIDFLTKNGETAERTGVNFYIRVKCDGANYWLKKKADDLECEWAGTTQLISITTTAPAGVSSWTTWKRSFTGLPANGPYTIYIYNSDHADNVHVAVRNVRFYCTTDEIIVKTTKIKNPKISFWRYGNDPIIRAIKEGGGPPRQTSLLDKEEITEKEYHVFNNISGEVKEYSYVLGDVIDADMENIISQCAGSLGILKRTDAVKVVTVTLTGTSGTANISADDFATSYDAVFNGNLGTTASDFVTAHAGDFADPIVVTSSGSDLIFTGYTAGYDFDIVIQNDLGSLDGTVVVTQEYYDENLEPTNVWSERGSAEAQPLLEFISKEIAEVYDRPHQLIQMPVIETAQNIQIDVIGNIMDDINLYGTDVRVFVINRGEFNVRPRRWEIDVYEVGVRATETESTTLTIKYGALYNWYAASEIDYLIAADGWHVPTVAEWETLIAYLGGDSVAGGKLKETGITYWDSPNTDATNEVTFNSRGAGFRGYDDGIFYEIKITLAYWCSDSSDYCSDVILEYDSGNLYLTDGYVNTMYRKYGDSIRLIKDFTTLSDGETGTYTGNDGKVYRTICIGTQEWLADNLAETKYSNGDDIPVVTDNAAWAALTTGAMCWYDNDISNGYEETVSSTVDSTLVTADNDVITVDVG